MKNYQGFLTGIGLGMGGMYLMDPAKGRRRRAMVRDQLIHGAHQTREGLNVTARDVTHRAQGAAARARRWVDRKQADDNILAARVRSKLGRCVSHPHAIEVTADQGRVMLRGLILKEEVEHLISRISRIQGVKSVDNQLNAHRRSDQIPALQGGTFQPAHSFEFLQENWSPAARLAVSAASLAPIVIGFRRKNWLGLPMIGIGIGLMTRAVTNMDSKKLLGIGPKGYLSIHKAINIDSSLEEVFRFLSDLENLGNYLPDLLEVRMTGPNRSRWSFLGPSGLPIRWNAVTTRFEPNRFLSWRSEAGSAIEHFGRMHFLKNPDGSTQVELDFSYKPPGGLLGHALARLFRMDPKGRFDDNLMRVKSLIERGPSERALHRVGA